MILSGKKTTIEFNDRTVRLFMIAAIGSARSSPPS